MKEYPGSVNDEELGSPLGLCSLRGDLLTRPDLHIHSSPRQPPQHSTHIWTLLTCALTLPTGMSTGCWEKWRYEWHVDLFTSVQNGDTRLHLEALKSLATHGAQSKVHLRKQN